MVRQSSRKRTAPVILQPGEMSAIEINRNQRRSAGMKRFIANKNTHPPELPPVQQPPPVPQPPLPPACAIAPPGHILLPIPVTGTPQEKVGEIIPKCMNALFGNGHAPYKAKIIAQALGTGELFGNAGMQAALELTRSIGRVLFRPWKLAKAIATTGAINGQCITALRAMEKPAKGQRVMMPHASRVHQEERDLEEWAEGYFNLPVQYIPANNGGQNAEGWGFDLDRMLYYVLEKYGLLELAQTEGIQIKITYDGAELTGNKGHCAIGIQIIDTRAKKPGTFAKEYMYLDEEGSVCNFQSRDSCIILRIALVSETKKLVKDYFGDIYEWIQRTGEFGLPGNGPLYPPIHPINWVGCHDKSAIWKVAMMGGACFNMLLHCNMCENSKHELLSFHEEEHRCVRCKETGRVRCRHWEVNDTEVISQKECELTCALSEWQDILRKRHQSSLDEDTSDSEDEQDQQQQFTEIADADLIDKVRHGEEDEELMERSLLIVDPAHVKRTTDPHHIDFEPTNTEECDKFNSLLISESAMRMLTVTPGDSMEVRRANMKIWLLNGLRIRRLRRCIDRDRENTELMKVEKLILCCMHAENRIAEKVLKCMLAKGFEKRATNTYDSYRVDVAKVVNENIFNHGTGTDGQWKFPVPDKKKGASKKLIGDVKLTNAKGRHFVEKVEVLLPLIFVGYTDAYVLQWTCVLQLFKECMTWLRQRENFTDDEIRLFQDTADNFIELWIELNGKEGMSCYLHDLAAGHFSYYLRKYRNLYRYSQQGKTSARSIIYTTY